MVFERVADQILKQLAEMNFMHAEHRQGIALNNGMLFGNPLFESCQEPLQEPSWHPRRSVALGRIGRVRIGTASLSRAAPCGAPHRWCAG